MESSLQRTVAVLLGMGSLLFLVAAFLPYSRVFTESAVEKRLDIILEMRKMWNIGQFLFGLGAVVTVLALGIQSYGFRQIAFARWSHLGVLLMAVGAIFWCWHLVDRTMDPEAFVRNLNTPYLFAVYSVLTQFGLAMIGIMLLRTEVANWVAWMFIIGSGVFLVLMIIFRDMPPFVYYVLTLIAAVVLFMGADKG